MFALNPGSGSVRLHMINVSHPSHRALSQTNVRRKVPGDEGLQPKVSTKLRHYLRCFCLIHP